MNNNNQAHRLRREVLIHFIRLIEGNDISKINVIPKTIAPKDRPSRSCCVFHDRAIIGQQLQSIMGEDLLNFDKECDLHELLEKRIAQINEAQQNKSFVLNLLDDACQSCAQEAHIVTNACRGCLARPCQVNCPKDAISFINHRAVIDSDLCINCGKCTNECAYHAIAYVPVPCKASCPVQAIEKDAKGQMRIDKEKCIACGKCMAECPFGAIMHRSQILDVMSWIKKGHHVTAAIAPAISGQFTSAKEQLFTAILQLGFSSVVEVAQGADKTIEHEAEELQDHLINQKGPLTTSCCPSYKLFAQKHAKELLPFISHTPSPMHFTAKIIKDNNPKSKVVFIGPCIGKMAEASSTQEIDAVITFEELGACFVAKEIEILNLPPVEGYEQIASIDAEGFANTQGVSTAVLNHLKRKDPSLVVRSRIFDSIDSKSAKLIKLLPKEKSQWDFCEVMACKGGCVGGSCAITSAKIAAIRINKILESKK